MQPTVHWLAGHDDWLRVSGGDRRIANTLRKMLSISSPLTLADAHDGLRRSFRPVLLPAEKLRRVCESLGWLTVDHDRLTVSTGLTLDQKRILSPVERRLVSIFRSAGPVLSFRRAVDLGVRSGLNRNTVGVYLTRTPILQTVERGRYALRGWPTTAAV
jgi:hypothetical protein